EMLLHLATDRLLALANHPGVVREAHKGCGVLANVQIHAADLLQWHSKHTSGLELDKLPRLGQPTSQDHGQEETDRQQRQEYGAPASIMSPLGLYRRFHQMQAPMSRMLSGRSTSVTRKICRICGLVSRMRAGTGMRDAAAGERSSRTSQRTMDRTRSLLAM